MPLATKDLLPYSLNICHSLPPNYPCVPLVFEIEANRSGSFNYHDADDLFDLLMTECINRVGGMMVFDLVTIAQDYLPGKGKGGGQRERKGESEVKRKGREGREGEGRGEGNGKEKSRGGKWKKGGREEKGRKNGKRVRGEGGGGGRGGCGKSTFS